MPRSQQTLTNKPLLSPETLTKTLNNKRNKNSRYGIGLYKCIGIILVFLIISIIMVPITALTEPKENSWISKAPMHVARSGLGVAAVNGKIYAIGGNTENGYIPNNEGNDYKAKGWITNANEEYDSLTDRWTFKTPMLTPRYNFAIAAYQNKIYCMGGVINWYSGTINYTAVNEVYDPATDTWETKAPMLIAAGAQASVVGDKIYFVGGGSNGTIIQAYDPAVDSWTMKTPLPTELLSQPPNTLSTLTSAVLDDKIYVISYSGYSSLSWIYTPSDDSWSSWTVSSPDFLKEGNWWSQAAVATTGIVAAKQIYVFFARYPYSTYVPNFAYEVSAATWRGAASVPTYRQNFGVVVLNDIIYVIGGRTYNYPFPDDSYFTVTEQAVNEQFTPFGYGTVPPVVSLVSLQSMATYSSSEVPLNFSLNRPAAWIGYSLDGKDNITINGNTTLTGLSAGLHNITVYAKDAKENIGASETITFTIAPASFPTGPLVIAVAASATVACVGLLLYFRKRRG